MRLFNFGRKEKKGTKSKGWRKRRHAEPRSYTVEDKVKILKEYEVAEGAIPIDRFCKWWSVSPDTLKGWQSRYKAEGEAGLIPRAKHRTKTEIQQAIKDKIIEIKQREPRYGVRRIADYLARHKFYKVSDETVREILKTDERVAGLMLAAHEAKVGKREPQVRRFERSKPRQLYQMDIMTWMLKGLYRVYLIGCLDDYSRYVVSWGLFRRQSSEHAIDVLRAGIERYGSPEEVLTDNGRQFYTWQGRCEFQKYVIKSGIKHIRSRPYHPATLGKIESFWRNMYQELLSQVAIGSFEEAEEKLKGWIEDYNFKRTHQGIDGLVPADRFFGVDKSIKEAMVEGAGIVKDSLILNPKEVKEPMYIIGRIGGKEIRIIAKEGSVVVEGLEGIEKKACQEDREGVEYKQEEGDGSGDKPGEGENESGAKGKPAERGLEREARERSVPGDGDKPGDILRMGEEGTGRDEKRISREETRTEEERGVEDRGGLEKQNPADEPDIERDR